MKSNNTKNYIYSQNKNTFNVQLLLCLLPFIFAFKPADNDFVTTLSINNHHVFVEVCATEESRRRGLMWRKQLDWDKGMLFVYKNSAVRHFWMKNTFIELDMAFIDRFMVIRTIHSVQTTNTTSPLFSSEVPVQYVLEVNRGWFDSHGITTGDTIRFEDGLPHALE